MRTKINISDAVKSQTVGKDAAKDKKRFNRIGNREIAFCGLFAALIAVGAFIKIPGPIVPFTVQFLFANLAGILLEKKGGMLAVGVYIALGLIGIPIFTEGGGIGYVLNPKFGYLIGFFVGAYGAGAVFERLKRKPTDKMKEADKPTDKTKVSLFSRIKKSELPPYLAAGFVNLLTVYFFGVIYYYLVARFYLGSSNGLWFFVLNCFLVFVPTDLMWCVISAFIAKRLFPVMKNAAHYGGRHTELKKDGQAEYERETPNCDRTATEKNEIGSRLAELKKDGQAECEREMPNYERTAAEKNKIDGGFAELKKDGQAEYERETPNYKKESDILQRLKEKILDGYKITKDEAAGLVNADTDELSLCANRIREKFCGNAFDMCSIINGKSGGCSENCKFCAQSERNRASCETYALMNEKEVVDGALYNYKKGVNRFSIVTAGRALNDAEVDAVCESYERIGEACGIFRCASHGLLRYEDFKKLRLAGVKRYHCNLETSRKFFPNICTTHTYDDKINAIKAAKRAGMEVCSGGIIGLGESFSDRIDMAFELRELEIKSVPINILNPIKGTELENSPILREDEVRKTVAIYRFILPDATLRMAGGRGLLKDKGEKIFMSGANAAATGDMLTTGGISIDNDMEIVKRLGYEVKLS